MGLISRVSSRTYRRKMEVFAGLDLSDSCSDEAPIETTPEERLMKTIIDKINMVPALHKTPEWESPEAQFFRFKSRADYCYYKQDYEKSLAYKIFKTKTKRFKHSLY